jgi:uncharacterized membrane protein
MGKMNLINKILLSIILITAIALFGFSSEVNSAVAELPVVRAVLFYSPSCGHCHMVITEVLPPLIDKYGDQLLIIGIDVSNPSGQIIYQQAIEHFTIPQERLGVPTLLVGEQYLVGSREIPEIFPELIEDGLQVGGVNWPDIPELTALINEQEIENNGVEQTEEVALDVETQSGINSASNQEENNTILQIMAERFSRDITGNTISTIILIGMIIAVIWGAYIFLGNNSVKPKRWQEIIILVLSIIGLGVAVYLAFIEVSQTEAVCGPVGDCNTVQTSSYAYLFGLIPIGVLGMIGYLGILIFWAIRLLSRNWRIRAYSTLLVWGMAIFGSLFSIYLTFLEPFIIGATCMWCISSALIMTAILILSTPSAKYVFEVMDDEQQQLDPDFVEY